MDIAEEKINLRGKIVVSLASGLGLLALSSLYASARIVCDMDGDCWRVHQDFAFPPAAGVIIHPDDWRWKDGDRFAWKEHEGRGYWHGGEWRGF